MEVVLTLRGISTLGLLLLLALEALASEPIRVNHYEETAFPLGPELSLKCTLKYPISERNRIYYGINTCKVNDPELSVSLVPLGNPSTNKAVVLKTGRNSVGLSYSLAFPIPKPIRDRLEDYYGKNFTFKLKYKFEKRTSYIEDKVGPESWMGGRADGYRGVFSGQLNLILGSLEGSVPLTPQSILDYPYLLPERTEWLEGNYGPFLLPIKEDCSGGTCTYSLSGSLLTLQMAGFSEAEILLDSVSLHQWESSKERVPPLPTEFPEFGGMKILNNPQPSIARVSTNHVDVWVQQAGSQSSPHWRWKWSSRRTGRELLRLEVSKSEMGDLQFVSDSLDPVKGLGSVTWKGARLSIEFQSDGNVLVYHRVLGEEVPTRAIEVKIIGSPDRRTSPGEYINTFEGGVLFEARKLTEGFLVSPVYPRGWTSSLTGVEPSTGQTILYRDSITGEIHYRDTSFLAKAKRLSPFGFSPPWKTLWSVGQSSGSAQAQVSYFLGGDGVGGSLLKKLFISVFPAGEQSEKLSSCHHRTAQSGAFAPNDVRYRNQIELGCKTAGTLCKAEVDKLSDPMFRLNHIMINGPKWVEVDAQPIDFYVHAVRNAQGEQTTNTLGLEDAIQVATSLGFPSLSQLPICPVKFTEIVSDQHLCRVPIRNSLNSGDLSVAQLADPKLWIQTAYSAQGRFQIKPDQKKKMLDYLRALYSKNIKAIFYFTPQYTQSPALLLTDIENLKRELGVLMGGVYLDGLPDRDPEGVISLMRKLRKSLGDPRKPGGKYIYLHHSSNNQVLSDTNASPFPSPHSYADVVVTGEGNTRHWGWNTDPGFGYLDRNTPLTSCPKTFGTMQGLFGINHTLTLSIPWLRNIDLTKGSVEQYTHVRAIPPERQAEAFHLCNGGGVFSPAQTKFSFIEKRVFTDLKKASWLIDNYWEIRDQACGFQ